MTRPAALAIAVLLLTSPCLAAEAPALPAAAMFRGDAAHTGAYPGPGVLPQELRWHARLGGKVRSTPAVGAGLVVAGSEDGSLYALDAASGAVRWKVATGGPVTASPAIAGGLVVAAGGDGRLRALAIASGAERWRLEPGAEVLFAQGEGDPRSWDFFAASPVIAGDLVVYPGRDATVYAVALADGAVRWKVAAGAPLRATPAVAGGVVYAGTMGGVLLALDARTGAERWRFKTEGNRYFPNGDIQSSPAVAGGVVVFGARDGFLYAVEAATGKQRWRSDHRGSWVITSPAVHEGTVVAGSSDGEFVQALELDTGRERWRMDAKARVFASPAIAGGLVYAASWDGNVWALDLIDGTVKGMTLTECAVNASPVPAGDLLLVGSDESVLYAFAGPTYDAAGEPRAVALEPAALAPYPGDYRLPSGTVIEVRRAVDALVLGLPGPRTVALLPTGGDGFLLRDMPGRIRFLRDTSGAVTGCELLLGGQPRTATRVP